MDLNKLISDIPNNSPYFRVESDILKHIEGYCTKQGISTFLYSHFGVMDKIAFEEFKAYFNVKEAVSSILHLYQQNAEAKTLRQFYVVPDCGFLTMETSHSTESYNIMFLCIEKPFSKVEQEFIHDVIMRADDRTIKSNKTFIQMFANSPDIGLNLTSVPLPMVEFKKDNYSAEINKRHEELMVDLKKTEQTRGRLTILQGPPGCGKTMYIRSLISAFHKDRKVKFLYTPITVGTQLCDPTFLHMLLSEKEEDPLCKVVLILEDADLFVEDRKGSAQTTVSEFLNTTDGMVGAALDLHIIATTNVSKTSFDPAVVRPGRLHSIFYFDKLSYEQANIVFKRETGNDLEKTADSFSLAEIYGKVLDHDNGIKQKVKHDAGVYL